MPETETSEALRRHGGNKALIDAMQAQKVLSPSTAAMAAGIVGPSATASKLAEALRGTGRIGGQHVGVVKLAASIKPVGPVAAAAENMRRATEGFTNLPRIGAGGVSPGSTLVQMMADAEAARRTGQLPQHPRPTALASAPRVQMPLNYSAELLKLQRQIEARRAEERAVEDERHEQSLAVQRAMHAALLESEAARAADAESAALREQALVDRAEAGDKRESRLLRLTVASVCVAVLVPLMQIVLPLI